MSDNRDSAGDRTRYPQTIGASHFDYMREALYPTPPEGYVVVGTDDLGDDTTLTFRLSSDLKAAIKLCADAFELSMGDFCRRAVSSVVAGSMVEPAKGVVADFGEAA
jgi:hypothetical protein